MERNKDFFQEVLYEGLDRMELTTQLLFSYKLNPQTVVFVGCSENRLGVTWDLQETDRTLFVKVGYAVVL